MGALGAGRTVGVSVALCVWLGSGSAAQGIPASDPPSGPPSAEAVVAPPADQDAGLPFFVTLGIAHGIRVDGCSQCPEPVSNSSFSGHLALGKYLVDDVLAVGLEGSVWRQVRPGTPIGGDSTSVGTPTRLVGHVGNGSLVFSAQGAHLFVRAGFGIAFSLQDVQHSLGISKASGWGVGYTTGVGATLPIMSMLSLAFFANYNTGWYFLATPDAVVEQPANHRYIEAGLGLTLR